MKFLRKNIENWRSWKIRFFLVGNFDFFFHENKSKFIGQQGFFKILMITLVSSPKQHLPKHMQHSVANIHSEPNSCMDKMFFFIQAATSPRSRTTQVKQQNLQYTTNWVPATKPTGFSITITEILISYLSTEILAAASIILGLGCQHETLQHSLGLGP